MKRSEPFVVFADGFLELKGTLSIGRHHQIIYLQISSAMSVGPFLMDEKTA
jgi:hypothetical protein